MGKGQLHNLILAAEMAAILAVCSQISFPIGVIPFTAQTLAVGLIASVTNWRVATTAICGYLVLGVIGLPVYAGGASGFAALVGPTGGFLFGFVIYALITSKLIGLVQKSWMILLANLLGATVQLLIGTLWLAVSAHLPITQAMMTGFMPFIIPGLIKIVLLVAMVKPIFLKYGRQLGQTNS